MDWRPEHEEDRPRASWKRTAFDVAVIALLFLAVVGAGTVAWLLVNVFPLGLP